MDTTTTKGNNSETLAKTHPVLEIEDLETSFFTQRGELKAVDHVSLQVNSGEVLGFVGESGCGKSVTALSVLRLVPEPPGKIIGGSILFEGDDLMRKSPEEMEDIRGNNISMIFQEPLTALNPVFSVGFQITEGIRRHMNLSSNQATSLALDMLKRVGIPDPETRLRAYPHQLSGGMRQRVMIAMALACEPKLLIADEPTTALDVTIQAQILELLRRLQKETGTSIVMITHDLGVIAEIADRVAVMYAGKVVETAPVKELFRRPLHPYTIGLISSIPKIIGPRNRLTTIPGMVPSLSQLPRGCTFAPRCSYATERCKQPPELKEAESGHSVRCWYWEKTLSRGMKSDTNTRGKHT